MVLKKRGEVQLIEDDSVGLMDAEEACSNGCDGQHKQDGSFTFGVVVCRIDKMGLLKVGRVERAEDLRQRGRAGGSGDGAATERHDGDARQERGGRRQAGRGLSWWTMRADDGAYSMWRAGVARAELAGGGVMWPGEVRGIAEVAGLKREVSELEETSVLWRSVFGVSGCGGGRLALMDQISSEFSNVLPLLTVPS